MITNPKYIGLKERFFGRINCRLPGRPRRRVFRDFDLKPLRSFFAGKKRPTGVDRV
jgi:hypothetical protein